VAGKMIGYHDASGLGAGWKPRLTRAYAEGRAVGIASGAATLNPDDGKGTPLEKAWDHGHTNAANSAYKREVAA
jgi:hypothetical protein